ncbi:MAG: 2-phospho-L-lactate transferase CofD family protein [Nitrososphaeria archaeon]
MSTAVLCGGTSGAKVVGGLYRKGVKVGAIVNTADDDYFMGLYVSPDFDSVLYSLAGIFDFQRNWGIAGDTFRAYEMWKRMGVEPYIMLGDMDLAVHIYRTYLLRSGVSLSEVFEKLVRSFGISVPIAPPTDSRLTTIVGTEKGEVSFEEYYVRRLEDKIIYIRIIGSDVAKASERALEILDSSKILIIAPSNPLASVLPILSVKEVRKAIEGFRGKRIAVSPFKGGKTYKGPAARMMTDIGLEPGPEGLVRIYGGLIDYLIVDESDFTRSEINGIKIVPHRIDIQSDEDIQGLYRFILSL